ncbi:MAG: hypothetical protein ACRDND_00675 [Streptosporangiaceae bacterium]
MTVHVISVGVSVLEHLKEPGSYLQAKPRLAREIERFEPWALLAKADAHRHGEAASGWLASAFGVDSGHDPVTAKRLAEVVNAVRPGQWPDEFSAELETFRRAHDARRPLPDSDIAVLVCSDTPEGLLAGMWNATALAGGELGGVRYLADPASVPPGLQGKAVFVRVPGLDAGREEGFRRAMRGLGVFGRNLLDSGQVGDEEPFRFYLSGGFKAAIPYLIGLAEGLASLPEAGPVEAYVLHDSGREYPPISLPLRRIAPERVQTELSGLSEKPSPTAPPSDYLDGYAYLNTPDGWVLTPFGAGLKALFKRPAPGIR